MDNKLYLQRRTEYLLQQVIDAEIERIKELNNNFDISHCCIEIVILMALKNQAKDLIDKL